MNIIHRSIWNDQTGTFVAVSENTHNAGKRVSSCTTAAGGRASFALKTLAVCLMMACGAGAHAEPAGGVVTAGAATIGGTPGSMVINQSTPNVVINWQSFGINAGESVQFVQPNSSSVALNRVVGANPSAIFGSLTSNGKVFLVNPNGILFGSGASVNVGGLVASTLDITDANFMAGNYQFSGNSANAVINQAQIDTTPGGYVALLGANVNNQGFITAQMGTVALAAGSALTMDMAGDKLLNVTVDQGAVNALVANSQLLQADGGLVLMTTRAAGSLLDNAVNNTGIVRAQTLVTGEKGTIRLLGGTQVGTVNVDGTLDARAPGGGDGGLIEVSASNVKVVPTAAVTAAAPTPTGVAGTFLIESPTFTVGSGATDNMSGVTMQALLVTTNITIGTTSAPQNGQGVGDITINEKLEWVASDSPTTLSLNASQNVNINAPISATNGNLAVCCGNDLNVNAAITTVNGSVLLAAGKDLNLSAALTTTDGNVMMCAAEDVNIGAKITLTHTTNIIAEQSLGLPLGLTLSAGFGGTGPGVNAGTVVFMPAAPAATVTNAPTTINYNPVAYTTPTDYAINIIGAAPVQHMVVYAGGGDKEFDGTTQTTLNSLKGTPGGVTLVAGQGSSAAFNDAAVGADKPVTFTGYTLTGANASEYVLAASCCGPVVNKTTATINAPVVVPPVIVPPVIPPVIPPVVVPPVVPPVVVPPVVPPVVVPPVIIPPIVTAPGVVPPVILPTGEVILPPDVVPQTPVAPPVMPSPQSPLPLRIVTEEQPPVVLTVQPPPAPPVAVIVPPPEKPYQPPVRVVKQDRN